MALQSASLNRTSFPTGFIFGTASSAYQHEGGAREGGRGPSVWDTYTHRHPEKIKNGSNGDVAVDSYHRYKEDVRIMKEMGLDAYRFSISWSRLLPNGKLSGGVNKEGVKFYNNFINELLANEKIKDGSNGDVAVDSYHRYKEDVGIMKEMGLDAYRFSISWSRLLPNGKLSGGVNKEGVKFYNNFINELLANGLKPFVTLFHWDLPQTLEDEYGGFLSPHIVYHFREYAGVCYKEFGDRVKHWITFNEPLAYSLAGYASGAFPPGRCSEWQQLNCSAGDSGTEPYIVTHHQLLAHAAAVEQYKEKYQASQKGTIGITLVSPWLVPYSNAKHHKNAALRALDFNFGWFMDPLVNGEYPHIMRSIVGERLPKFTKIQSKTLQGSFDFIGVNYYTSYYAAYAPKSSAANASLLTDSHANLLPERKGIPIGPKAASDFIRIYPRGIRDLLLYIKTKYHNPLLYITENGVDEFNDPKLPLKKALIDNHRIDYHYRHLYYLQRAIKDGVNVKGYFAWSLLDNFEWTSGYTVRFGINFVDYKNGLKRYPKLSAHWFKKFLIRN